MKPDRKIHNPKSSRMLWRHAALACMAMLLLALAACGGDNGVAPPQDDGGVVVDPPQRLTFRQIGRDPLSNDLVGVDQRKGVALAISRFGFVAIRKGASEDWFSPGRVANDRLLKGLVTDGGALIATGIDGIYRAKEPGGQWTQVLSRGSGGFSALALEGKTVVAFGRAIFTSTDDGATWTETTPAGFADVFTHAVSLGPKVFLGLTTTGDLFRSEDDGATWQELIANPPVGFFATAMDFFDDQHGIVVAANSPPTTLITDTGGKSWQEVASIDNVREISTTSGGIAVALLFNNKLRVSTDGGATFGNDIQLDRSLIERAEGVHAITATNWLVVGENGAILETFDGGANWTEHTRGLRSDLCEMAISADGVLVALPDICESGFSRDIAISVNGGRNFTVLEDVMGEERPNRVIFRDNRGVILGNSGSVLFSDDGGRTWGSPRLLSESRINDMLFTDDGTIIAATSQGEILRSTDNGTTFSTVFNTGGFIRRLMNFPGTNALVLSGDVTLRSTDLGANWTAVDTQGLSLREIAGIGTKRAFAIGGRNTLLKTTDAGKTWQTQFELLDQDLERLAFNSPLHGLLLTEKGIMQSLDGGENWELQEFDTGLVLQVLATHPDGGTFFGGSNGLLFEGTP